MDRMTGTCGNITFPQLRWRAVTMPKSFLCIWLPVVSGTQYNSKTRRFSWFIGWCGLGQVSVYRVLRANKRTSFYFLISQSGPRWTIPLTVNGTLRGGKIASRGRNRYEQFAEISCHCIMTWEREYLQLRCIDSIEVKPNSSLSCFVIIMPYYSRFPNLSVQVSMLIFRLIRKWYRTSRRHNIDCHKN